MFVPAVLSNIPRTPSVGGGALLFLPENNPNNLKPNSGGDWTMGFWAAELNAAMFNMAIDAAQAIAGAGMGHEDFAKNGWRKLSDEGGVTTYTRWVQDGNDLSTLRSEFALSANNEMRSLNFQSISNITRFNNARAAADNNHWYSWNGPVMRYLVPDKISLSIGGDISAFLGVGAEPLSFTVLTRGKDPGLYLTPTFHVNVGGGVSAGGGFSFSTGHYTGDPRDISASMLQGSSYGVMATGGYIADLSLSASFSPTNNRGTQGFINTSVGVGAGFGVFGGGQYQYTPGYGSLWKW